MKRLIFLLLSFIFIAVLFGCGTTGELREVKNDYNDREFVKVASRKIECKDDDEGCNQVHLLKGNACYQLGKQEKTNINYFDCAVTHLEKGIRLTKKWDLDNFNLNRDQNYINLCESLREKQDLSKGEVAENVSRQLLKTSEEFVGLAPDNLAAIYFKNIAKFTLLRKPILMTPENPQVCGAIRGILSSLNAVKGRADQSQYAANYSRLIIDVEAVKPALVNCP